jgi:PAS domain S-box-containing protein
MKTDLNSIQSKYYITTTTNIDGTIIDVSDAFCKVSGYTKEEIIGKTHSIIKHPDTPKETFKKLWETVQSGKKWTGIFKNKRKDGSHYYVDSLIEPIFDENYMILGYHSLRFEITNQYELITANKNNEISLKKFEKLFANIHSGIAIIDEKGFFIDVNPYLCKLFGYTKEEYMDLNCINTPNKDDSTELKELISKILNKDIAEKTIKKMCKKKDGTDVWVEATYVYFDESSILISINDIGNLKKLEHTTNILISQSRNAAMGEMLSMIAHQWRQPLTTLATIVSKMKVKNDLDIYSKNAFDLDHKRIDSIIMHLSKTIEYFRNYLKPKSIEKHNIYMIIKEIENIIEPLCVKNHIELRFNYINSENLEIDTRIDQVLLNIYKNAIEACYEKNSKGKITTEIKKINKKIYINIYDDAGGIPENLIDKIFEPYFSTKNKNGTGLGLYMCKDIIENNLEGKLQFKNIDNGACFMIEFSEKNEK